MAIALWCVGAYLGAGVGVTLILSETPYADNGWLVTTLLWPLFIFALIIG